MCFVLNLKENYTISAWITITFVGDSVRDRVDPEDENATITVQVPRLLVRSWYPWDAMSGMPHYISLGYQVNV